VQGSSRIAGEKSPNNDIGRQFTKKLQTQLQEFLDRKEQRKPSGFDKIHKICLSNAEDILNRLA
jgi:hypothetical protein